MSSLATAVMGGSSCFCFLTRSVSFSDLVFNEIFKMRFLAPDTTKGYWAEPLHTRLHVK